MPEPLARWFRGGSAAAAVLVFLLAISVHSPALQAGFIVDDDVNVTENETLRDGRGLLRIWTDLGANQQFYPLTYTTYWLQYRVSGLRPLPYHAVDLILHGVAAVLLGFVLRKLEIPWGWLAAAWFAVHPVQVESVAWITERRNVLSGLLAFAAALAYLRFALPADSAPRPANRGSLAFLSVGLFALALLAKTSVAILPVALALAVWWKRGSIELPRARPLFGMLLLALAAGFVTLSVEKGAAGAEGAHWDLTLAERWLVAGKALWFYLGKLLVPIGFSLNYPRWSIETSSLPQHIPPAAALGTLATLFALRSRIGLGPFAAFAIFAVALAPVLGFFDVYYSVYSFVADRWVYLACVGPMALAASAMARAARLGGTARRLVPVLAVASVAGLGVISHHQAEIYRSPETLWRHVLEKNPDSWMAHLNLGKHHERGGRADLAIREYALAVTACPFPLEYAHIRLAELHAARNDLEEAARQHRMVLEVTSDKKRAHVNLGNVLADLGRRAEAEKQYGEALEIDGDFALAHYNLAAVLAASGRREEAIRRYREAIRSDPGLAAAYNNLAVLLYEAGRHEEARRAVEACLGLGGKPHPEFVRALSQRER